MTSTLSLYPNPASEVIYVVTNSATALDYQLYDLNGRMIYSGQVTNNEALDISMLEQGVYLVYLPASNTVRKFVKN